MFISKKSFNNMQIFLADMRQSNVEITMLAKKLEFKLIEKEARIESLKKILASYQSKWIKVTCPECKHTFDFHTIQEK